MMYCTRCKVVHFQPKPLTQEKMDDLNARGYESGKMTLPRYYCKTCRWWQVMSPVALRSNDL